MGLLDLCAFALHDLNVLDIFLSSVRACVSAGSGLYRDIVLMASLKDKSDSKASNHTNRAQIVQVIFKNKCSTYIVKGSCSK